MDIALAHGYAYGFNPFWAFFGFLFNLLFLVLFVAFILWLLKGFRRGRWGHAWKRMRPAGGPWGRGDWFRGDDEAMETARERFARGEVTQEQYESIKTGLQNERAKEAREAREDWNWKGWWHRDNALEVARMRFARGEISLEELEAIKRGLES